ncbi:hypothetical protein V5735_21405 (plasmid) [Haladaptatus sp. SPP-AMP-3]|uniref:hypothetical protein n=1 Tax=Haladaptatus sp. SPP-AMP-3 TaxID=3121295 RepID=UPI003C2B68F9
MPDEHDRWTIRRYRDADKNAVLRVHDRSLRDLAVRYSPEDNRCLRHTPTDFLEREGEFLVVTDNATIVDDRLHARTNGIAGCGGFRPRARVSSSGRRGADERGRSPIVPLTERSCFHG